VARSDSLMDVRIKRIYEPAEPGDGFRVLIDRLWPRGVSKQDARLGEWARELAPSDGLRRWFGHDPARFDEFARRYREELSSSADAIEALRERAREGTVTIVFGARDAEHSNAAVLADVLRAPGDG
jgi:uncharacterized protein YeaO (DUF488 family)